MEEPVDDDEVEDEKTDEEKSDDDDDDDATVEEDKPKTKKVHTVPDKINLRGACRNFAWHLAKSRSILREGAFVRA